VLANPASQFEASVVRAHVNDRRLGTTNGMAECIRIQLQNFRLKPEATRIIACPERAKRVEGSPRWGTSARRPGDVLGEAVVLH
jgi:hypothetical protein